MPAARVEVVTPPAGEPVTLADLKAHLRIDWDDEDAALAGFLTAARQLFELRAGRTVLPTVVREHWAGWPARPAVFLRSAPVVAAAPVLITYRDAADALVAYPAEHYRLDGPADPALLALSPAAPRPPLSVLRQYPVTVQYTAGWPDAAAVPAVVKAAIKLLAGHYYEVREAFAAGPELKAVPLGFQSVCDLFWTGLHWGA